MLTVLLIYLFGLLLLILGVSLIVSLYQWRPFWRLWGVLAAFLVATPLVMLETARPFSDDGPFRGTARADCPTRTPDQSVLLSRGDRIESFDPRAGERAPTVRLRTPKGTNRWCIYADATRGTQVKSVRFGDDFRTPLGSTMVDGTVVWTYGTERASWYLGPRGGLRSFYYSW